MSEERVQYSAARPYKTHSTDSADAIGTFMEWLQQAGASGADPVGVEVGEEGVALSWGEDVYAVSPGEEGQFARAALAAAIMGDNPPRLVAPNAEDTLVGLAHFLAWIYNDRELFGRLAQCMLGDLLGCASTTGHAPAARNLSLPDAAYTARLLEPQYQHDAPAYYNAVTLPLARLRAEWRLFGEDTRADWWVSYPDLWIRVLTRYTADPTLVWMLNEGQEPLGAVARLFEWPLEQTAAVLLWHICGRSVDAMADLVPGHMDALPDNLPVVSELWNRRLPSLWTGIAELMGGYQGDRLARTLYGRKLRGGRHPGVASAHAILGTVDEILEVAAVTFWNRRPGPSVMIKHIDSFSIDPVRRVVGVGPQAAERERWIETLTQLAPLAAPLGTVSLAPTVVRPPEESSTPAGTVVPSSTGKQPSAKKPPSNAKAARPKSRRKPARSRKSKPPGQGQ